MRADRIAQIPECWPSPRASPAPSLQNTLASLDDFAAAELAFPQLFEGDSIDDGSHRPH